MKWIRKMVLQCHFQDTTLPEDARQEVSVKGKAHFGSSECDVVVNTTLVHTSGQYLEFGERKTKDCMAWLAARRD